MNGRILGVAVLVALGTPLGLVREGRAQSEEAYRLTPRAFALGLRTSGVYDSNIDHDDADIDSRGVIAGIEARLQSSARRPLLTLRYEGALRRFANTERWNRVEHEIAAVLAGRSGPLTLATIGEVDFKAATEDRELGNQYTALQRLSLSLGAVRLRAYGGLRLKTIDDATAGLDPEEMGDEEPDDFMTYSGGEIRWKTGGGNSWSLGYRYEDNRSDSPSRRYIQQRYVAEYQAEFTDRDALELGLEYRPRRLPDKLVEVETLDEEGEPVLSEEPREDVRWIPYVSLSHVFPWGQEVELEYEYQHRASNDLDKEFEAHRVMLTLRLPLISRYRRTRIYD